MAFVPYMVGGFAIDKLMGGNGVKGALAGTGLGMFAGPAAGAAAVTSGGASTLGSGAALMSGGSTAATGGLGANFAASTIANPLAAATPISSATSGAASSIMPSHLTNSMGTASGNFGTVNPATTGGASEGISMYTPNGLSGTVGGNTGLIGQQTSNQAWDSALTSRKGLFDTAFENASASDVFDYAGNKIKTGFNSATDYIDKEWEEMSTMEKMQSGMVASNLGTTDETKNQIQAQAPGVLGKTPGTKVRAPIVAIDVPGTEATTSGANLTQEEIEMRRLREMYGY